jgi:hypothetical protein
MGMFFPKDFFLDVLTAVGPALIPLTVQAHTLNAFLAIMERLLSQEVVTPAQERTPEHVVKEILHMQ